MNGKWAKAWWRKATALRGLQHYGQALDALSQSYKLVEDKAKAHNEYHRAVSEIASRMTREQLADFVITILHDYEAKGIIAKPSRQTVSPQEKREAMFLQIKSWQSSTKKTQTDYENCVASWTLAPMSATMAYVQVRLFCCDKFNATATEELTLRLNYSAHACTNLHYVSNRSSQMHEQR